MKQLILLFRKIILFRVYCQNIVKNKIFLQEKYALNISLIFELYTTITLSDAPDDLRQKYGSTLAELEIKKYIAKFNSDLPKLELEELVNVYEIKKLNEFDYGIAFGYSQLNNTKIILTILGIVMSLITTLILLIII